MPPKKRFTIGNVDDGVLKAATRHVTEGVLNAMMDAEESLPPDTLQKSGMNNLHHFHRAVEAMVWTTILCGWSGAMIEEFGVDSGVNIMNDMFLDFSKFITSKHPTLKFQIVCSRTDRES